ncbi:ATP-grasp domain-containing protein [Rhodococcus tibetensis]|uniref:ATP-grasp domain-containing protein n=1 Tax=Rhodococcus tibetensis TaxID=2965064 RepID=A0ABT1QHS6_9NOCA|nr:ATP-grasp domain-containing protein [Rhodococcus sp. FXJ9.536]MCQ4120657.1 ATP-grasp domain-containing protein [Rhodococcus sp. FXJ9.536]
MRNIVLIGGHDETFTHFAGLGFQFTVLQLPSAIGPNLRTLTDHIFAVADFEPDTVVAEIARIMRSKQVDYIFSFTEGGLLTAAIASHRLSIPGLDLSACELCIDKQLMRTFLEGTEFAVENAACRTAADVETFLARHPRGLVLKDPAGSGSESVFIVRDELELSAALTELRKDGFLMLAEEYLPGREVSVETLTVDGKHRVLAVTNKKLHRKSLAEEQHIISPDVVDATTFDVISAYCERLLNQISYQHGPCHIEVKITDDGLSLIEINNRVGGDYIGLLVELTTGVSQLRETLRCWSEMDRSTSVGPNRARYTYAASHQFYEPTDFEHLRSALRDVDIIRLHIEPTPLRLDRPRTNDDKIGWVVLACNESEPFKRAIDYLDVTCS